MVAAWDCPSLMIRCGRLAGASWPYRRLFSDAGGRARCWGAFISSFERAFRGLRARLMPGLAYQLGILLASPTNSLQFVLHIVWLPMGLAGFELATILDAGGPALARLRERT